MRVLKAKTSNGKTEYFNLDKILTVVPGEEYTKILMGAGLYWNVEAKSIEIEDLSYKELEAIARGEKAWL